MQRSGTKRISGFDRGISGAPGAPGAAHPGLHQDCRRAETTDCSVCRARVGRRPLSATSELLVEVSECRKASNGSRMEWLQITDEQRVGQRVCSHMDAELLTTATWCSQCLRKTRCRRRGTRAGRPDMPYRLPNASIITSTGVRHRLVIESIIK